MNFRTGSGQHAPVGKVSEQAADPSHAPEMQSPSTIRLASPPYLDLLQAVNTAIIATDLEGRITFFNRFAERLYGWSSSEVLGQSVMEIIVPDDIAAKAAEIMTALQAGQSWSGEFQVRRKDGSHFTAWVTDSPITDDAGVLIGIVGISQDWSLRKQVEEASRKAQQNLEIQVQQRTAELNFANASLRQLSARLLQAQDEERRRLARELHDSVGQLLAAIGMNIAIVRSTSLVPEAAKAARENAELVQQVTREIRTMSHLLHPPLLDEAGLGSALKEFVHGFSERSRIAITLEVPGDLGRLGDEVEIALFRVVQECLTNVHRHSGSRVAEVCVRNDSAWVRLEVRDSGKGISVEKQPSLVGSGPLGVGFRGMRERITQLGGVLEIRSGSSGTTVSVSLPNRKQADRGLLA